MSISISYAPAVDGVRGDIGELAADGQQRRLQIEVLVEQKAGISIRDEAVKWLRDTFSNDGDGKPVPLLLNNLLEKQDGFLPNNIKSIYIGELGQDDRDRLTVFLKDVGLSASVYRISDQPVTSQLADYVVTSDLETLLPPCPVWALPSPMLLDSWSKLIFIPTVHIQLLAALARLVTLSRTSFDHDTLSSVYRPWHAPWTGIVLLWGPPGTGKSTLCRALAQRLSIRLQDMYPRTKLVEISAPSLYSKYFSESAKLVEATFTAIRHLVEKNRDDTLVCVVIDEVESLSGAREQSVGNDGAGGVGGDGEPRDVMRAVNALLTSIDRLRSYPNFIVFCTSNLIEAMDSAFLDRVDFKWHIGLPKAEARYEVLRQGILDLVKRGFVIAFQMNEIASRDVNDVAAIGMTELLPLYSVMFVRHFHNPAHPSRLLWDVAERCKDFSVRRLQRLPAMALVLHTTLEPCPLLDALAALNKAVKQELDALVENGATTAGRGS